MLSSEGLHDQWLINMWRARLPEINVLLIGQRGRYVIVYAE